MNAQTPYEIYRVITDLEALEDGFLDRIDDLNTTIEQIEMAAGMARGQLQKCLAKNPGKAVSRKRDCRHASNKRTFGWESLPKTLKGTGMALVLVVDDERFAPLKEQLMERKRPRKPTNVSIKTPSWLFTKRNARNMRDLGIKSLSPQQRRRIAKKAAKARWQKRRKSVQKIDHKVDDVDMVSARAL